MLTEFFSKNHIRLVLCETSRARLFFTCHAIRKAGKILFIDLCDEGDELHEGDNFGDVEGFKGVFELICPVNCKALRVNDPILSDPSALSQSDWLVEVELNAPLPPLMTSEEYSRFAKSDTCIKEKR